MTNCIHGCRTPTIYPYLKRGSPGRTTECFIGSLYPRLFREAMQLKTVGAVVRVADVEPFCAECHTQAADTVRGRRPTGVAVADVFQLACLMVAAARGSTACPVYSERQRN